MALPDGDDEPPILLPVAKPMVRAARPAPPVLVPPVRKVVPAAATRRPRRETAKGSRPSGKRKWWLLAGVLGVVVLGMAACAVAGILWLGKTVEKEQEAGGPSQAVAAARPASRPHAPVRQRIEMPAPVIDKATWNVRADPVPLADDLLASVPIGDSSGTDRFCFADPAAGKVLLVESKRLRWIDLRTGETKSPLGPTVPAAMKTECSAIGPSGERFSTISRNVEDPKESYILGLHSCRDGRSIGTMPIDRKSYDTAETFHFLDENRVLHYQSGRLRIYDFESGKLALDAKVQFSTAPRLTPGRKYIYGRTASGYEFFDTAEGKSAGLIRLDGPWRNSSGRDFNVETHFAIDCDGRRGLLVAPIHTSVHLAAVDLDTGKVKESVLCDDIVPSGMLGLRAGRAGDRLVVFDTGYIVDLSTKSLAMNYALGNRTPLKYSGYLPDRRTWLLQSHKRLVGVPLPAPADLAAADGFGPYPWPIGTLLRVEASGPGDIAFQTDVAEIVAKAFAERGFPIDPNAKARVTVTTGPIRKDTVLVSASNAEVKRASWRDPSLKDNDGTSLYYKSEKGLTGEIVVETFDAGGEKSSLSFPCPGEVVGSNEKRLLDRLSGQLQSQLDSGALDKPRLDPADKSRRIGRDIPIKVEGPNKPPR